MRVGDHIRNRRVKGAVWQVTGKTKSHVLVRCLDTGIPARVRRSELDRWKTVFVCRPGLEGLERKGAMWVRSDAPVPRVSLK
jgi:hypothetical protein